MKNKFDNSIVCRLRMYMGMSQEEFAKMVGCSRWSIPAWETLRSPPSYKNMLKLTEIGKEQGFKINPSLIRKDYNLL